MKLKKYKNFLTTCLFIFLCSCKTTKNVNLSNEFINYYNNYEYDKIANIITTDFKLINEVSKTSISKNQLTKYFIPLAKALNQKYNIVNIKSETEIYAIDYSIYEKYLNIKPIEYKIVFIIDKEKNKIAQVQFENSSSYNFGERELKMKEFEQWITKNHPNENIVEILFDAKKSEKYLKLFKTKQ